MLYKTAQVEMGKEAEVQNYLNSLGLKMNHIHRLTELLLLKLKLQLIQ